MESQVPPRVIYMPLSHCVEFEAHMDRLFSRVFSKIGDDESVYVWKRK